MKNLSFGRIDEPALAELLATVEPRNCPGCGANDWANLQERMHYIFHLFRALHETPSLFDPPFSPAQVEAFRAGEDIHRVTASKVFGVAPEAVDDRALLAEKGLSLSLGPRIDGIPLRDLIGGNSGDIRRPGYTLFIDPGVSFTHGRHTFWVNTPVRIHQDFKRSLADIEDNRLGGGDLAKYLVLTGYSIRF